MEKIELAKQCLENMPSGGIGEMGATQDDLDAAAKKGESIDGDAEYHNAQQAWLYLNDFLNEN